MKSRSVSITGATGFLGWHLSEAFRDAGWHVRAIVRPGNRKPVPASVEIVEAALDRRALPRAFGDSSLIVHSAALVRAASVRQMEWVNVQGTREVVEAASVAGARLIFLSSQAAFGPGTAEKPSRESDIPQPLTAYGRSKLAAEAVVRSEARVPWTIVRPSAVYGPRDHGFLPLFRLASRGIFLMVAKPTTRFTLIYVDDLVHTIVTAATDERASNQTFFLGHPDPQTADDLMRSLADAFGRAYRPLRLPPLLVRMAGAAGDVCWKLGVEPIVDGARASEIRAGGFVCAVDLARDLLGFTGSVRLSEGVARTARWYRDRGWV
jgi:nucleoside-diphosphate-sugar epimerase